MAVSYAGRVFHRPNNGGRFPLILRNPQDVISHSQFKLGPNSILAFGPNDYRMWIEGVANTGNPLSNWGKYAYGGSPWSWRVIGDAEDIAPLDLTTWEKGEFCPTTWWYDEYDDRFKMVYHGGNNAGPRQIGLMTAPRNSEGRPGSWVRYGTSPVVVVGGSGAADEADACDACVIRISRAKYIMLYRGSRASDNKDQLHLATSTDLGYTWSKYGSNPVMALGSGNDANGAECGWGFLDTDGRIHFWYIGRDAGSEMRVLYGFSGDDGQTWTRNQAQVAIAKSATGSDPDAEIGDTLSGIIDEGFVVLNCMNANIASYTDGRGRLEGRGQYWLPREAVSTPARPGRVFNSSTDRMVGNAAAGCLNNNVGTIYCEFKLPPIPGSTSCTLYHEYGGAFNKEIWYRVNNSDGSLEMMWRTPTGLVNFRVKGRRYDDGLFHWAAMRRTASNAFELIADGRVIGTASTTVSTDASAVNVAWGNFVSGVGNEPFLGLIRRGMTIAGTAWTVAEMEAFFNSGKGGVAAPSTPTSSIKFGSGGLAGPDTAQDGAAYGATLGAGTVLVDAEQMPALMRPASVRQLAQLRLTG